MDEQADLGANQHLRTPENDAARMAAAERLERALNHYLTPEERALLTPDDVAFLLSLDDETIPEITFEETQDAIEGYRERIRSRYQHLGD